MYSINNNQQDKFSVSIAAKKVEFILNSNLLSLLNEGTINIAKAKELGFSNPSTNDLVILDGIIVLLNNLAQTGVSFVDSISVQSQYLPMIKEIFTICASEDKNSTPATELAKKPFQGIDFDSLRKEDGKVVLLTGTEAWIAKSQGVAVEWSLSGLGWAALTDAEWMGWSTDRFANAERLNYQYRLKDSVV